MALCEYDMISLRLHRFCSSSILLWVQTLVLFHRSNSCSPRGAQDDYELPWPSEMQEPQREFAVGPAVGMEQIGFRGPQGVPLANCHVYMI